MTVTEQRCNKCGRVHGPIFGCTPKTSTPKSAACKECHHAPSMRVAEYGTHCHCKCHDIADAAPELLEACREAARLFDVCEFSAPEDLTGIRMVSDAIAKAEGRS